MYHLRDTHPEKPNTCGISTCPSTKDSRSLLRHLNTSKAHSISLFYCRCEYSNGRQDKFREHCMKDRCAGAYPYRCSCGACYPSSTHRDLFLEHLNKCGRRRRGRPRANTLKPSGAEVTP
ncbi:hypothetical protein GGR52DRAFT_550918 [Hypoxylon sp. FL1284]|nr:hypothetical protein GGR52DRAFT_550918 [Hypoxylon sp. FL1284]